MPYTTGAAPVRYCNLQTSREVATASTTEIPVEWSRPVSSGLSFFPSFRGPANVSEIGTQSRTFLSSNRSFWNTESENLSMSLSVTAHQFAKSEGLGTVIVQHWNCAKLEMVLTIPQPCNGMGFQYDQIRPYPSGLPRNNPIT